MLPWILLFLSVVPAQAPAHSDIRVDVDLVNVSFTVRNRDGALQPLLHAEDFRIFEDGVEQTPAFFSRDVDLPLTLGIVMDLSGSQGFNTKKNIDRARAFLKAVVQPGDSVFVLAFQFRLKLVQDLTSSIPEVADALINVEKLYKSKVLEFDRRHRGASPVRDALYFAARERMKSARRRKALIIVTDGDDNASHTSVTNTIEMLQSADTAVYAINAGARAMWIVQTIISPQGAAMQRLMTHNDIRRIATETGGAESKVNKTNLNEAFERIQEELRTMYVVGYRSSNPHDGKWHKIEIRPARPDLVVKSRTGYRAAAPSTPAS